MFAEGIPLTITEARAPTTQEPHQ
ncbi:hypothetical protein STPH1_2378 [Streptomyces sp. OM5714]|nr:hypothetical protein STPH1_2378 [Streptomyces sp. OM5714]